MRPSRNPTTRSTIAALSALCVARTHAPCASAAPAPSHPSPYRDSPWVHPPKPVAARAPARVQSRSAAAAPRKADAVTGPRTSPSPPTANAPAPPASRLSFWQASAAVLRSPPPLACSVTEKIEKRTRPFRDATASAPRHSAASSLRRPAPPRLRSENPWRRKDSAASIFRSRSGPLALQSPRPPHRARRSRAPRPHPPPSDTSC